MAAERRGPKGRAVLADGGKYASVSDAGRALGVRPSTITLRIKRGDDGYAYIGPPVNIGRESPGRPPLPDSVRDIARLKWLDGMSASAIADALGIGENSVYRFCADLRARARRISQGEADEMLRLRARGFSSQMISERTGRSASGIRATFRRIGGTAPEARP